MIFFSLETELVLKTSNVLPVQALFLAPGNIVARPRLPDIWWWGAQFFLRNAEIGKEGPGSESSQSSRCSLPRLHTWNRSTKLPLSQQFWDLPSSLWAESSCCIFDRFSLQVPTIMMMARGENAYYSIGKVAAAEDCFIDVCTVWYTHQHRATCPVWH